MDKVFNPVFLLSSLNLALNFILSDDKAVANCSILVLHNVVTT